MLKSEKYVWLLGQVLTSLLFYFAVACSNAGAAQGWRHPPPGGLDAGLGLVFHDTRCLRWGVEAMCSADGAAEAKRGFGDCPQRSQWLLLLLNTLFPKMFSSGEGCL